MSKDQKIHKLVNAVKDWRGAKHHQVWTRPPQEKAQARVEKWIGELGLPVRETREKIHSFNHYAEFFKWIKSL